MPGVSEAVPLEDVFGAEDSVGAEEATVESVVDKGILNDSTIDGVSAAEELGVKIPLLV